MLLCRIYVFREVKSRGTKQKKNETKKNVE
jgi:hypothetical protein